MANERAYNTRLIPEPGVRYRCVSGPDDYTGHLDTALLASDVTSWHMTSEHSACHVRRVGRAVSLPEEEREERHRLACVLVSHHIHYVYTIMYIMADFIMRLTSVNLQLKLLCVPFMYFFSENNIMYMHFIVLHALKYYHSFECVCIIKYVLLVFVATLSSRRNGK